MKNKLFEEALNQIPEETKQKVREMTDFLDSIEMPESEGLDVYTRIRNRTKPETENKVRRHMTEMINRSHPELVANFQKAFLDEVIDDAFALYMPQVRKEIFELACLIDSKIGDEPFNILEIGTKFGGTFHIWNRLNTTEGLNISIDFSDGGIHGGISDEEMDKRDQLFTEKFDNCHFIRGNSHHLGIWQDLAWELNSDFSDASGVDFLFIDGDHSYKGVKQDFLDYSQFVKKGGLIAFHDIVISDHHHSRNVYVGEFWEELTSNRLPFPTGDHCFYNGQVFLIKEFIYGDGTWAGIGILERI